MKKCRALHVGLGAWILAFVLYMLVFWIGFKYPFLKTALVSFLCAIVVSLLAAGLSHLFHPPQDQKTNHQSSC